MDRKNKNSWYLFLAAVLIIPFLGCHSTNNTDTINEARALAEEAYIFAFPMLEHYRTMQAPIQSGQFNRFQHTTEILGPESAQVVRPNNDTIYSMLWLDLRSEPMVLHIPPITDRYYSFQFIDLYTHNFAYAGVRTTGTGGGVFMVVGPDWTGEKPAGVDEIFQSEGNFVFCLVRTALEGPDDLANVLAIQNQYHAQPLSGFLGVAAPPSSPMDIFPFYQQPAAESIQFIEYFNFLLGQLAIHPSEKAMIERFGTIGIGPSYGFNSDDFNANIRAAIEEGISAAQEKIFASRMTLGEMKNGWVLTKRIFGNREQMQGRYLTRAGAARTGLYGNDLEEAYYPSGNNDHEGEPFDASMHTYVLRFTKEQIPAVDAFWSITMYNLPEQLMVNNPIHRYSIGDRTQGLKFDDDGSLELYLSKNSPGSEKESNWLPAPDGSFSLTLRMYMPQAHALDPLYAPPEVVRQTY